MPQKLGGASRHPARSDFDQARQAAVQVREALARFVPNDSAANRRMVDNVQSINMAALRVTMSLAGGADGPSRPAPSVEDLHALAGRLIDLGGSFLKPQGAIQGSATRIAIV